MICLEDGPSTSDEEAEYYSSDESCDSVLSNDDILDADAKMEMRPNFQQKESPESSIGSFLTQQTKQVAFMRLVNSFKSESVSLLPIRFILSPFNRPAAAICLDYLPAITTMSWIERNRAPQERTDTLEKLFQSSSVFKSVRNSDFYCSSDGARESRRSFRGNKRSGSTFPHLMNHSACTDVNIEALRLIRSSIRIDV